MPDVALVTCSIATGIMHLFSHAFLQGKYFEAVVHDIDPVEKTIVACFPADAGLDECCFKVAYDILVLGEQHNVSSAEVTCSVCPSD